MNENIPHAVTETAHDGRVDSEGQRKAMTLPTQIKVLVAIDGSQASLEAARHALRLHLLGLQCTFVLVTVQERIYNFELILAPGAGVLERLTGAVGERALAQARLLFDEAGVSYETEIGAGEPAPTLLVIAARFGCEFIVMGARGHGALRGALLGSVSQAVLHTSLMPIVIVRQDTEQL